MEQFLLESIVGILPFLRRSVQPLFSTPRPRGGRAGARPSRMESRRLGGGRDGARPSRMESRHLDGVYRMNIVMPP
jgi:hypothetical protein